ncbi:hypothetical protein JL722_9315 [Aureococcus anophagefferens]|nr:hypothetical protein JL722_9315 [Aureococcus anophagefferens]
MADDVVDNARPWNLDFETEDDARSRPVEALLGRFLGFTQDHEEALLALRRESVNDPVLDAPRDQLAACVRLDARPPERAPAFELARTGERSLRKVLAVFAFVGDEELANFVERCHACALNITQQLAALYSPLEASYAATFRDVRLCPAFETLADLLRLLATVDRAIQSNDALATAWVEYKRLMQRVRADPDKWAGELDGAADGAAARARLAKFERLLADLERSVLHGACFKACVEMDFEELVDEDEGATRVNVRSNPTLLKEFERGVRWLLEKVSLGLGTASETTEREQVVGVVALYAFSRRLAPPSAEPDAKLYRQLWALQSRAPVVTLGVLRPTFERCGVGNDEISVQVTLCDGRCLPWFVGDFLAEHAPPPPATARARFARCAKHDAVDGGAKGAAAAEAALEQRGALLLQALAPRAHAALLRSTVALHVALALPFSKSMLAPLASLVEGLKALDHAVRRHHAPSIAECTSGALRALSGALAAQLAPLKARLARKKYSSAGRLDALAAVEAATHLVTCSDAYSQSRVGVLELCLHVAFNDRTAPEGSSTTGGAAEVRKCRDRAHALLRRLGPRALEAKLRKACDCSCVYWSRELFQPMLDVLLDEPGGVKRLPLFVLAVSDVAPALRAAQHVDDAESSLVAGWTAFVFEALEAALVTPLCHRVENELRLRAHALGQARGAGATRPDAVLRSQAAAAHVGRVDAARAAAPRTGDAAASLPLPEPSPGVVDALVLPPLRVLGRRLDVKRRLQRYLEKVFYDLTVVALHDWSTYAEMKQLCLETYGVALRDNHLPMGSLDVGLDVLRIMQNIDVFVSRFSYNLNQQNFVERRPDRGSKNIRTINIRSIAASLKQHGLGVLNTTVNYTYQFLATKFHVFNQFLYDDYIRSHLSKERRWFRKHRESCDAMYPYDRAAKFAKDVRKLGVGDDGRSFLDHFRVLITEIGNALGYVRMVRSAGAEFCADAARFVPDFDDAAELAKTAAGDAWRDPDGAAPPAGDGAETAEPAAESKNFAEGRDYFKVLVNVFKKVLLAGDHAHLDNFYTIVPALCLSWVEASLVAKDRMFKQNRSKEAYYTDDGFAVGVAYVLAILEQGSRFDSLHWFERVKAKLLADEAELAENLAKRAAKAKAKEKARKAASSTFGFLSGASAPKDDDDDEEEEAARAVSTLQLTARRVRRKSLEEIQKLGRASSQDNHFVRQDSIKRQSILRPESRDDDDAVDFEVDDAAAATEPPKPPTPPTPPAPTLQPSPRSVIPAAAPAKEAPATPKEAPSVVAATRPPREAKPAVAASKPAAAVQAEPSTVLHVALGMVLVLAAAFVSSALKELFNF